MKYICIDAQQVGRFIERMGKHREDDYEIVYRFCVTINELLELI